MLEAEVVGVGPTTSSSTSHPQSTLKAAAMAQSSTSSSKKPVEVFDARVVYSKHVEGQCVLPPAAAGSVVARIRCNTYKQDGELVERVGRAKHELPRPVYSNPRSSHTGVR